MELKEFFKIFIIHKRLFFGTLGIFIICGVLFYFFQPQTYKTSLTLNITRDYSAPTQEYSYDDFYRLQADEKFAETVVRWIKSPYIIDIILKDIEYVSDKKFEAKRLSSQVVDVSFVTPTQKEAIFISKNLIKVINEESQRLNSKQEQDNWFIILGSKPIVEDYTKSLLFLISLGLFTGLFVGFWLVMIKHYIIASSK